MNIKKGDTVKILSGTDRSKTGKVLRVYPESARLTVEGMNLYKRRVKPKTQGQKGETVLVARPMASSKAMIVCQSCKKATRVGYRVHEGSKERFCKKCQATT
jgi:large subunit ribosomal protein L24